MNVVVTGPVAAALILANVDLGNSFNIDDGSFNNCEAAVQAERPNLDKEAVRLLAIVKSAQGLAVDLAKTQAEHLEKAGPNAEAQAVYAAAKAKKLAQLAEEKKSAEFAELVKKAEADAEAEHDAANAPATDVGPAKEGDPPPVDEKTKETIN